MIPRDRMRSRKPQDQALNYSYFYLCARSAIKDINMLSINRNIHSALKNINAIIGHNMNFRVGIDISLYNLVTPIGQMDSVNAIFLGRNRI